MNSRKFTWGTLFGLMCILAVFAVLRFRRADQRAGEDAGNPAPTANETSTVSEGIDDSVLPRATLAGRVTDPAKRPIAGASVCAFASSERLASAETREPRCVVTDEQGRYRIGDLFAAKYRVSAAAPQHQPAYWHDGADKSTLDLKASETRENVDIVLDAGGVEVRGRVKDISGGIITGALVSVSSLSGGEAVTESNAQGEWQVWVAPGTIQASAMANGYADGSKEGTAPGQFMEIVLTPESVLQGKVVEAGTETPVAGARVSAGANSGEGAFAAGMSGMRGMPGAATAVTDAEGRFRIARLSPGRYKPQATSAHRWGIARESVLLGLGETSSELIIEAHPAFVVSGRVMLSDAKPCTEGSVSLMEKSSLERRMGSIDKDGQARVEGVLPGHYEVEIDCVGAASEDKYEPVALVDKDVSGLTWKVGAGLSVRGVVVESNGEPVGLAHIWARPKGGDPRARTSWGSTQTEKNGTFELRGLLAATYALEVHLEGHAALKDPVEVKVDRDVDGLRIVLPASGNIEGTVADNAGAPVPGMSVRVQGKRPMWNHTSTRDDGTFVVKGVSAGDYRVWAEQGFERVRAPGTKDEDVQGVSTTVRAGETARVKLVVESRRGQIRGKVVGEVNEPLSDVFVDAERESEDPSRAAISARMKMQWQWGRASPVLAELDGSFTIDKLAPGTYTVRAYRKGGGESVLEKVRVGSQVTLTIRTGASISGIVVGAGGKKSPERFTVAARDPKTGLSRQESFFRTDGAFVLRELPAGTYQVSAEASEGRAIAEITLAQSEKRQNVRLEFEANAQVRGRVVALETGEPVAGMYVFASPAKGAPSMGMGAASFGDSDRKNITDANGRFELDRCPAGRVYISTAPKDYASSEYSFAYVPATIEAGRVNEIAPLRVPRRRTKGLEMGGDLGFSVGQPVPGMDLEQAKVTVSVVRPNGPAARAGLTVGDEIVSVDGYSVAPPNMALYHALSRVSEGTSVTLGLARGGTVVIRAEKPL